MNHKNGRVKKFNRLYRNNMVSLQPVESVSLGILANEGSMGSLSARRHNGPKISPDRR